MPQVLQEVGKVPQFVETLVQKAALYQCGPDATGLLLEKLYPFFVPLGMSVAHAYQGQAGSSCRV